MCPFYCVPLLQRTNPRLGLPLDDRFVRFEITSASRDISQLGGFGKGVFGESPKHVTVGRWVRIAPGRLGLHVRSGAMGALGVIWNEAELVGQLPPRVNGRVAYGTR